MGMQTPEPIPFWIFLLLVIVLLVVFIVLYFIIKKCFWMRINAAVRKEEGAGLGV